MKRKFREGAGAGYDLTIRGLEYTNNIKVEPTLYDANKNGGYKYWTCDLAKCNVEYEAEGYDWGISDTSEYSRGNKVNGGYIRGIVYLEEIGNFFSIEDSEVDDDYIADYIRENLPQYIDLKDIIGGGNLFIPLDKTIIMGNPNPKKGDIYDIAENDDYYVDITIGYAEIESEDISESVNWYHANYYDLEDEFMEKKIMKRTRHLKESRNTVEIDADIFMEMLYERANYFGSKYYPNSFWDELIPELEGIWDNLSIEYRDPSYIIDNIAINGSIKELDEVMDDYDLKTEEEVEEMAEEEGWWKVDDFYIISLGI